ncbi:MAG: aminotransferase, partial [Oscillospiraceae bacterium]
YRNDEEFCVKLAEKVGVGAVPGSSFFKEEENRYIRMHFAKRNETLNKALNRLESLRSKM